MAKTTQRCAPGCLCARHAERAGTHPATRKPTARDLEWAAGFLEGEGYFSGRENKQRVEAAQLNPEPLAKLLEIFGGRVKKYRSNYPIWLWIVHGARARGVMMTLYPLLSHVRQTQIRVALHGPIAT